MSDSKLILITGANSGVGYETVKIFLEAERSYHILLGARTLEKADNAAQLAREECGNTRNTVAPLVLDVSSDESIEAAFRLVQSKHSHLDVLINNAGATFDIEFVSDRISLRDCFNKAYDVNVAGANCVSYAFMPLLLAAPEPRLLFVAGLSFMTLVNEGPYFPTPPQPAGWPKHIDFETIGYRCSKTALNMLMMDWNHKLKEDGVKVWAVSPGFLATNLGNLKDKVAEMGGGHPREGAVMYKSVVEGQWDGQVGKVISKDGLVAL